MAAVEVEGEGQDPSRGTYVVSWRQLRTGPLLYKISREPRQFSNTPHLLPK